MTVRYLLTANGKRILGTRGESNGIELAWQQADLTSHDGIHLGRRGGAGVTLVSIDGSQDGLWLDLRHDGHLLTPLDRYWLGRAQHVLNWRAVAQHCGACGDELDYPPAVVSGVCRSEGGEVWPRVDPEVLVLGVDQSDRATLVHARHWPRGLYSAVSGYVEAGESAEMAAARELLEETGLRVVSLSYAGSSAWPYPHCLLLAFQATVDDREPVPDGAEITSVIRLSRGELGDAIARGSIFLPPPASMARTMIDDWLEASRSDC